MKGRIRILFTIILVVLCNSIFAQQINIFGKIIDDHTSEPVPFASVQLKQSLAGTVADSAGNFSIWTTGFLRDTLTISYVGYDPVSIPLDSIFSETKLIIPMKHPKAGDEVIVVARVNPGLLLWRRIMKRKPLYNKYNLENFGYEAYNKLEIDLKNINFDKLKKNPLTKSYSFIFDNIDSTSEKDPFLPAYLVETLSDYAFQKKPKKYRETVKAANTKGLENESITKMIGVMYQNVNIFSNFIKVMDKDFVSPFNDNADAFYRFFIADTQVVAGKKMFHFVFKPKRPGQNTFEGDAWVQSGSYKVDKISMFLGAEANINYIDRISIFQEFAPVSDSLNFLVRDKFFADFRVLGKKSLTMIGRKTTSYKDIVVNSDSIRNLFTNQNIEEVITTLPNAKKTDSAWSQLRHDSLSENEKAIYATIDKLLNMPKFQKLQNTLKFIGTGYKNIGNIEIGPWYNWISANAWEGTRFRFDLGTNTGFHKNLYLHTYLAYGTDDKKLKGLAEAYYIIKKKPLWSRVHLSYQKDIDNGISQLGEVSQDNIFTLAIRKPAVTRKFLQIEDIRFDYYRELGKGLSAQLFLAGRNYTPLQNLPILQSNGKQLNVIRTAEVALRLRFAYLEQFFEGDYFRYSLGTDKPVYEVYIAKNIPAIWGSKFDYTRLSASYKDNIKLAPFGNLNAKIYAGKIFGTAPFPFLELHPGNDIYYYNPSSFNLMTRFEYLSDQFAGLNIEHQIGSGIFRFFGPTRKLKWRQFWNFKTVYGSLSEKNNALNNQLKTFKTLNNTNYTEIGTGVDNILKVMRIDFVWRISANPTMLLGTSKFGVFGSFQFQF